MKVWLRKSSWAYIALYALLIIVLGRPLFRNWNYLHLNWLLGLSLVLFKYKDDWPVTQTRLAYLRNTRGSFVMKLIALLPPVIPALFTLNRSIFAGFLDFLFRRPTHSDSLEGVRFTYLLNSQYSTFVIIIFIGLFVEVPFSIILINAIEKDPGLRTQVHFILLLLTIYTFIVVMSDRWQLQSSEHVVGEQSLHLRLGFRFSADIAFEQINKISVINESKRIWCVKNKISFLDEFTVTPIDQPQVLIEFKENNSPKVESLKLLQNLPKYLFVFVDKPQAFVGAIEAKLIVR